MAGRPKKNTVDYFPHYCTASKTMFILEQKYKNDGYSFWFKLLEILGCSDNHFIDCRNVDVWEFLQAKTRLSEDICIEILNLLARLEAIDKELWKNHIIWCQHFVNNLEPVYNNRKAKIPLKPNFYDLKSSEEAISTNRNNNNSQIEPISTEINAQSKVEESKEEERKVEESKEESSSQNCDAALKKDFIDELLDLFCEEYKINREDDYELITIDERKIQRSAIGKLLKRHKEAIKMQGISETSEETKSHFRMIFKNFLSIQDSWHKQKMSPMHILNKWQELKNIYKLEKEKNNGKRSRVREHSQEELERLFGK